MGREGVAHGIYHHIFNLLREEQGVYTPIRGSGMSPRFLVGAEWMADIRFDPVFHYIVPSDPRAVSSVVLTPFLREL